jgi:hypothetical protein
MATFAFFMPIRFASFIPQVLREDHFLSDKAGRSPPRIGPDGTLIAVIELSLSSWLVAGIVPGVERQLLKKLAIDESALLKLLHRWREEATKAGHRIKRIAVAFEAAVTASGWRAGSVHAT